MLTILTIGKKHDDWILPGLKRYEIRLKKPFDAEWTLLPHSRFDGDKARQDESEALFSRLKPDDFVILLDETGKNVSSPEIAEQFEAGFLSRKRIVCIIGGAYGVDSRLQSRADFTWSLSKLVFPHQLVRLLLIEQIYRAQSISSGGKYHHE